MLRPRLSTAFLDPFAPEPTLAVLCGHYNRQGRPLAESPDTLVRAAHERLRRRPGFELHALGEIEYFLGHRTKRARSYGANERGYHASSPFVFGEALRRKALVHLAEMGVPVKYGHAEVGYVEADAVDSRVWEQHEIELWLQPLPAAADAVVLTQWVLRNLALRAGMLCSFAPMAPQGPRRQRHALPFRAVRRRAPTCPTRVDGTLTSEAKWLDCRPGEHGAALMAFGNRSRDSFVRLSQGKEAPERRDLGPLQPQGAGPASRLSRPTSDGRETSPGPIEFRLPDGSAHPHLLLAGIAQALVAGRQLPDIDAHDRTDGRHGHGPGRQREPRAADVHRRLPMPSTGSRDALEAGGVFSPRTC